MTNKGRKALAALMVATALTATPALIPAAAARGLPESFSGLVKEVGPAVVQIRVEKTEHAAGRKIPGLEDIPPELRNGPFRDFFDRFGGMPGQDRHSRGLGSGFIIDGDGTVVTNNHVVEGADRVVVKLKDGRELTARVLGTDPKTDLAVLKIDDPKALPTVSWGNSDTAEVGDWVVAVGSPFGLGGTVTAGIISGRGREIGAGPYDDFIQIDAPINPGNSGGPLFDTDGRVIGVNTAIISPGGGNVGIGFAIPATIAKNVVAQLKKSGSVERGFLGVMIQTVTRDIADSLGMEKPAGALVTSLDPSGPAAKAGIRQGDVITRFGTTDIGDIRDLTRAVADTQPGEAVRVEIHRNGRVVSETVTVGTMKADNTAAAPATRDKGGASVDLAALGLELADVDIRTRSAFGLADDAIGAVVTNAYGAAAEKGLLPGDLIVMANGMAVTGPGDVEKAVADAEAAKRKSVLLLVNRGDSQRFVAIEIKAA